MGREEEKVVARSLVTVLLPLYDNEGTEFGRDQFAQVRRELIDAFGGVTAYFQSPAEGVWEDEAGRVRRDRIVVIEVMTSTLDREWWGKYRKQLEQRFRQDTIVIRSSAIETL